MSNLKRTLFASSRSCQFGCRYCFAKFADFNAAQQLPDFSTAHIKENYVIYPTCDGEFFTDSLAVSKLEKLVSSTQIPILVSISVKSPVSVMRARFLRDLNDRLGYARLGLVKCSVSLSTKYQVRKYEPRTPDYAQRIQALKALSEEGIPTSVNLKPILPMVSVAEYDEIIDDTAAYTGAFLIGGLYLDPTSEFGRMIGLDYARFMTERIVDWLPERPNWSYCEDPAQIAHVRRSVLMAGSKPFDTDIAVMAYLSAVRRNRATAAARAHVCV